MLCSGLAWGQAATALNRFEAPIAGSRFFSVDDVAFAETLRPRVGLTLDYADRPLVLVVQGAENERLGAVVNHQLTAHAALGLELFGRLVIDAVLPVTFSQGGGSPEFFGRVFESPRGAAFNDLRLGAGLQLWRQEGAWPGASVVGQVWLPSGDSAAYTSGGETRWGVKLNVGAERPRYLWRISVGRRYQAGDPEVSTSLSSWALAFGLAAKLSRFQIGPEVHGATASDETVEPFGTTSTSVEGLLGCRYALGDWTIGAAGGPGITIAPGTPRFRGLLSVTWVPTVEDEASVGAQVRLQGRPATESDDQTLGPSMAGIAPPRAPLELTATASDLDGDGVVDEQDRCPSVVGEPVDSVNPGCPKDSDQDGIYDRDDACPAEPGVMSEQAQRHGCAADTDSDGILDKDDACPAEQGHPSAEPSINGCRPTVVVKGQQLVLVEQIRFETGKDVIDEVSYPTLMQIADLLREQPDVSRVAVDGHTDDVGREEANLALSRRRALAVVRWLIEHGVDERRLEARGYGPRRPLDPAKTPEARARNRRVEFNVLKRSPEGERAWKDGPVQ